MDLDDLLRRYFGTSDITEVGPQVQAAGIERILVDFGLERDRGKRFALWTLLYLLAAAPDLDGEEALNFMDLLAAAERG